MKSDEFWMTQALELAQRAKNQGEVPVGALLVIDDVMISSSHNQPISKHDPTAHAEIIVLREAARVIENYRIINSTLYVTLEPCAMCAGAMVHARISKLVYGAFDIKTGACGSIMNLANHEKLNHKIDIQGGILEAECALVLREFFKERR